MDIGSYVGHVMVRQSSKKKLKSVVDVNVDIDAGDYLYDNGMSIEIFSPKKKRGQLYSVNPITNKTTSLQLLLNCKKK